MCKDELVIHLVESYDPPPVELCVFAFSCPRMGRWFDTYLGMRSYFLVNVQKPNSKPYVIYTVD